SSGLISKSSGLSTQKLRTIFQKLGEKTKFEANRAGGTKKNGAQLLVISIVNSKLAAVWRKPTHIKLTFLKPPP
ncbi:MAG: hypothetical protein Q4E59_06055, partial [Bacteroidales bacterium]|nr:hypothetical protein [Bacteroidales bacterium]